MSDFKIQVDALVNIDNIKNQLSQKLKSVDFTPKMSSTSAAKMADDMAKQIKQRMSAKLTDIKFTASTKSVEAAMKKLKQEMDLVSRTAGENWSKIVGDEVVQKYVIKLNNSFKQMNSTLGKTSKEATKASASLRDIIHSRENEIKINFGMDTTKGISTAIEKVKAEMIAVQQEMNNILSGGGAVTDKNYLAWEDYYKRLLGMQKTYTNQMISVHKTTAQQTNRELIDNVKKGITPYGVAVDKLKEKIDLYKVSFNAATSKMQKGMAFKDLTKEQQEAVIVTNEHKKALGQLDRSFSDANTKAENFTRILSQFVSTRFIVYGVWKAFKEGISTLREIDDTLVNIRKVAQLTAQDANKLAREGSEIVGEYGRRVQDFLAAYEEFARAGFRGAALKDLSELSLLLQNVGDVTADMANKTLIATNAGFKLEGNISELTKAIDAMNEVANNNATNVGKMSDAIRMSANVASTAGFEFNEFISIIGTATAVTQREGSEIGRAVRTIVANIRQISDAEAEVDEETWAKAGRALDEVAGISVVMNGELRDTMDVLTELSGKWDTLNSVQKQQLANDLANKRQMDVFLAIMDNWNMVEKQMGEAVNSTGSALRENEIYLDSMSAKVNDFRVNVTRMWQDTIDTGAAKSFIEMGSKIINVINDFGLINLVAVLAVSSLTKQTGVLHKAASALFRPFTDLKKGLKEATVSFADAKNANKGLITSLKAGTTTLKSNAAAWSSLTSIIATVAVIAITQFIQKSKELNKELSENIDNAINTSDSIKNQTLTIKELTDEYDSLSKNNERTVDDNNRLIELNELLKVKYDEARESVSLYGGEHKKLPEFIDATSGSIDKNTDSINANIESLRELSLEQSRYWINTNKEAVNQAEAFEQGTDAYKKQIGARASLTNEFVKEVKNAVGLLEFIEESNVDYSDPFFDLGAHNQKIDNIRELHNDYDKLLIYMEDLFESGILTKKQEEELSKSYVALSDEVKKHNKVLDEYDYHLDVLGKTFGRTSTSALMAAQAAKRAQDEASRREFQQMAEDLADAEEEARKLTETFDNASSNALMLADAYYTVANNQQLNSKQISELLTKYPQLASYYDANTNTLNVNAQMIDHLINKELNLAKSTASGAGDRLRASLGATSSILEDYKKQIEGMEVLSNAEMKLAKARTYQETFTKTLGGGTNYYAAARAATAAQQNVSGALATYNREVSQIAALQSQLGSVKSYGTTTPNFEKMSKDASKTSSNAAKASSDAAKDAAREAEKAAEEAYRRLVENTEDKFQLIRHYISDAYEKGSISAKEALARTTKEINSLEKIYVALSKRGQNTLNDAEKAVMKHYESLISMQEEYQSVIQKTYDDAVSNVESLQSRVVSALKKQVEESRDLAVAAIEKERDARLKAFDERIEQLNAEKKALQSTEEQEKKNLKELERKLELSKLDETVFGTKRTAELQKEVDDLRRDLAIAAIDKEIEKVTERKETEQESYNTRITNTQNFYAKQLEDARIYANANKLIMSQNMTEIVNLLKAYDPQFAGIGQMLGASMGSEIKKQVQAAMASIQTIKVGTASIATSYKPTSSTVSSSAGVTSSTAKATPTTTATKKTTPKAPTPTTKTYTIKKGDTYWGIAGRLLGNSMRYSELEKLNPTKPARNLQIGDKIKVPAFNTGGIPVMSMSSHSGSGIAIVEDKERILTERQTNAFDYMVYDILPKMTNSFERLGGIGGTTYNGEVVKIIQEIYNNTPFDINNSNDNLSRMMRNELQKLGI